MYGYSSNVITAQTHHEAFYQAQGKASVSERLTLPEYLTDESDWLLLAEIQNQTKTCRKKLKHVHIPLSLRDHIPLSLRDRLSLRERPLGPESQVEQWLRIHTATVAEGIKQQALNPASKTSKTAAVTSCRREHENSESGSPLISTDLAEQLLTDTSWPFPIPTPYDEATAQRLATEAQVLTEEKLVQHCIYRFDNFPVISEDGLLR